ncbi:mannosyltransferase [Naegleria gruberi]|uniref:Mannosyltransferase n=1 Tax=Naegleria gruberi TaxID=5762 RepID=D2V298_NAEGR|nr:mannosyltransferase [Naegleria gruberi]EFC48863.1 mannosyltransferase [Naegleria gruberi]|eukprot:XP_002681607.1 mannosyltransferase [Naegleria gruberi strain NEG-M]
MRQHLTRKNIAFAVMGFLILITLFQFFIGKHIGNTKHDMSMKIQHVATIPDQNIQNEVVVPLKQPEDVEVAADHVEKEAEIETKPTTVGVVEKKEEQKVQKVVEKKTGQKKEERNSLLSSTKTTASTNVASTSSQKKKKNSKLKKQKKENTKPVEETRKSTKLPPVYFLFICTLDKEQCEKPKQQSWKDSLIKSYNQISSTAKDNVESINFVIFGGDSNIPSLFTRVETSQKGIVQSVSDFIANSIKDDNAMIIFITDLSIPVSHSFTDTYYMLQDSILVGSIVINEKSGKILNSGWDLKLRSCKGQTTHSIAFTPHMYGKELSALLESNDSDEEEMVVFIPSFNGASILKQTWKYFGGFQMDYRKDYIFDFLLRIQEHNQVAPIIPENIVKSYGSENYEEYIISDTEPCSLDEKISFRNAESEISKQYYESTMNSFFNRLEVKNINLIYTIPADLPSQSLQQISNAINIEGKIILKLNTTLSGIHVSESDRIAFNRMKNIVHSDANIPLVNIVPFDPNWNCPRKQYCIGLFMSDIKQIKQEDVNKMKQQYDEIWVSEQRHAKLLKRMGIKKSKTQFIPNGVDTLAFKQDENKNAPTNYLSVFSDWEKERNQIKLLVESFATSFDQVSNVKLTIFIQDFTSASNDKTSQEIIKQLGIETVFTKPPSIEILPLDARKVELPSFYRDYHVLLILTENQSARLVMQAMSSGLLIVSPGGELFEFLNKDNSLIIKQAKSVESWIETLKYIHSEGNLSLIHELCKVARLDMVEYYDNTVIAKDILSRLGDIEEFMNAH